MIARLLPAHARSWLLNLTADQRDEVLGRLWDLGLDDDSMVANAEALDPRGRATVRIVLDPRAANADRDSD